MAAQAKKGKDSSGVFQASKASYGGYNDDAFGLVFLSGFAVTQDVAFAVSFVGLSALAAATTNGRLWNQDNDARVPGAVALAALVLGRPLVAFGLLPLFLDVTAGSSLTEGLMDLPPPTAIPPTFEIAVCIISVAWAFFNWKSFQEKSSE
jgi:hypothetical protein